MESDDTDRRRIKADPKAPFAGLAFKIINDKYGTLTFVRVYAGTLKSGDTVLNTTQASTASGSAACSRCTPTSAPKSRK